MRRARRRGAGARWAAAPVVAGPVLLAATLASGPAGALLPGEAEGEIRFQGDAGLFLDARGRTEVYICLAVPQEDLRCETPEGGDGPRAEIAVELAGLDASGNRQHAREQRLVLPCVAVTEDGAPPRRLVHLRAPWPPGPLALEVRARDLHARRTGLLYQMRGEERRGILRGELEPPPMAQGRGLSSCLLLWDLDPTAFEAAGRLRLAPADTARGFVEPNPMRAFGLLREKLLVYVEVYGLAERECEVEVSLVSLADGARLLRHREGLDVPWDRTAVVAELDVAGLNAGTYDLRFALRTRDGDEAWETHGHVQVLWRAESWGESQASLVGEMDLLLDPTQLEAFRALEPGQREAFSESLWAGVDGFSLAGTSSGPARTLFAERVRAADARFGGLRRGSLTDRGRVYVRYGEPDEVHKELLPTEENQIASFLDREVSDDERMEAGSFVRRSPLDASAYEVWYYAYWGEPLIPGQEPPARGRSLEFVFVDELGNGQYRLIYSNLFGGLH